MGFLVEKHETSLQVGIAKPLEIGKRREMLRTLEFNDTNCFSAMPDVSDLRHLINTTSNGNAVNVLHHQTLLYDRIIIQQNSRNQNTGNYVQND